MYGRIGRPEEFGSVLPFCECRTVDRFEGRKGDELLGFGRQNIQWVRKRLHSLVFSNALRQNGKLRVTARTKRHMKKTRMRKNLSVAHAALKLKAMHSRVEESSLRLIMSPGSV